MKAMAFTAQGLAERARQIYDTWPVFTSAPGRVLMAGSLMRDMLKEKKGPATLQPRGKGPLGSLTVTAPSPRKRTSASIARRKIMCRTPCRR